MIVEPIDRREAMAFAVFLALSHGETIEDWETCKRSPGHAHNWEIADRLLALTPFTEFLGPEVTDAALSNEIGGADVAAELAAVILAAAARINALPSSSRHWQGDAHTAWSAGMHNAARIIRPRPPYTEPSPS